MLTLCWRERCGAGILLTNHVTGIFRAEVERQFGKQFCLEHERILEEWPTGYLGFLVEPDSFCFICLPS